jgi:very-short-patch-repair endonuclease
VKAPHVEGVRLTSGDWQARRDDIKRLIDAGERIAAIKSKRAYQIIEDAWTQDLLTERQHYANLGSKWYRGLVGEYRRARARLQGLCSQPLPKDAAGCLALIDDVLEVRRSTEVYQELEPMGRELFAAQWQRLESDWPVLRQIADWVVETYRKVGEGALSKGLLQFLEGSPDLDGLASDAESLIEQIKGLRLAWDKLARNLEHRTPCQDAEAGPWAFDEPFATQLALLDGWLEAYPGRLHEIARFNASAEELRASDLEFVLPEAEAWARDAEDLPRAFIASWYHGLIDHAYRERSELARFDPLVHDREISRFRELDSLLFRHNQIRLVQQHWQHLPSSSAGGEVNVLTRQFNLKRKHLPIRKLMEQAGRAIQALKPVFMMSPMSIATFLPRGGLQFDLVVFDEASQVKPVDAFGAILRGKQTVVVGDSRQLPPSNFFAAALDIETDDEDDQATGDLESVLGLFLAQGAPQRMLRWHYRSRHESLIALSNQEFYENKLVVFPSPGANPAARGLVFNHLPHTVYDRGSSRTNKEEAEAIARAVLHHAHEHPELTLGVVAFSVAQRDAIQFAIERLRRVDSSAEAFFQDHPEEPFFVKNLENVQGDERDVILISVGYGMTEEGYLSHSFGPLNRDGGERRLNVLITRARLKCEVFANFTADDLDPGRSKARGVTALKRFLAYAKEGVLETPLGSLGETESPFEDEVAKALINLGHRVESQVGCAGFRIDLAIVDPERPGRYLLGIECDGATYHSSRSARDRDRLRQQVLEGLGWRIHRIWSTDWFRSEDVALKKVQEAIHRSVEHWRAVDRGERSLTQTPPPQYKAEIARANGESLVEASTGGTPYERATLLVSLGAHELHELGAARLASLVERVVETEGPVHCDVVVSRITSAAGVGRAGRRIKSAIEGGIAKAKQNGTVEMRGEFLTKAGAHDVAIRDRSSLENGERKSEWIADEEIEAALIKVVAEAFSICPEDAGVNAMALLGFRRRTKDLQDRLQAIIERLIQQRSLEKTPNGWLQEVSGQ